MTFLSSIIPQHETRRIRENNDVVRCFKVVIRANIRKVFMRPESLEAYLYFFPSLSQPFCKVSVSHNIYNQLAITIK